jgi:CDP-glycerol glycerophosphotransferase (TagB/SpsB family)
MVKEIVHKCLQTLLVLLSYLVPKDERLILCGCQDESFKGNPKYFYLYLQRNNGEYRSLWVTGDGRVFKELYDAGMQVVHKYSPRGFWAILRAKWLVVEVSIQDISYATWICNSIGRFNLIQTYHGTPLKFIGEDAKGVQKRMGTKIKMFLRNLPFVSDVFLDPEAKVRFICSASQAVSKNLESAFPHRGIKITGYPRNDIFFDKQLAFNNYNKIFDLESYHKVITYVPTWRDVVGGPRPFSEEFLMKLNDFLIENNYIFLFKKHVLAKDMPATTHLSNIRNVSEEVTDIQEVLIYTDVLITDYSSVFFDFVLTNKPIIFYPYDYEFYTKHCRGMYYSYFDELPGPFAGNEEELLKAVENVDDWFTVAEYKKKYELFKNEFNLYKDKNSSERLYNEIKD